jgi:hypothetical protein
MEIKLIGFCLAGGGGSGVGENKGGSKNILKDGSFF